MPTILTCAKMAQNVYDERVATVDGFHAVDSGGTGSSFFGATYRAEAVGVIAFRGSLEREDWTGADVDILRQCLPTDQLGDAFSYFASARQKLAKMGCKRLVVTGHSLGGALAAMVAARVTTVPVVGLTFNAPGLFGVSRVSGGLAGLLLGAKVDVTIPAPNAANVTNVRAKGDLLIARWGQPIGRVIEVPDAGVHTMAPLLAALARSAVGGFNV